MHALSDQIAALRIDLNRVEEAEPDTTENEDKRDG
jgi:hypothetical protein